MPTYPAPRIKLEGAMSANGERDQWLSNLATAHNDLVNRFQDLNFPRLVDRVGELESSHLELERALRTLRSTVVDLAVTVELATNPNPSKPRDDTNDRIVAYLRDKTPGQWLNPSSIAVNLGLGGKSVAGRLDRLARDSKVERTGGKGSGTDPLYRVVPEAVPGAEE